MKKQDVLVVFLVLMNVALIIKIGILGRNISALSSSGIVFAPHFVLVDLDGGVWTVDRMTNEARHTMLVFFSPQDCADCLLESSLWESIYRSKEVAVIGIARHVDERELILWVKNAGITFPVLFDKDEDVAGMFQIRTTPQKVIIDNSGRILLRDSVRVRQSEYQEFVQLLREAIY